ncbi:MAG: hypothetical protein Q8N35_18165 [Methylococcaceae bacterium]|nr:hypothetical protein [Methylococcaceae bacterium]MDZ4155088.1 hypothetical protein [Methylococcales bacterium]MDP2394467.1 hypothetical protein [Methylococcaceae bacterium]MDP3021510.1 hypothetical protein [Methylococcaceae bacterium]MDP3390371.1 hypothetical protein [Methylococcaceae bacterium]
MKRSNLKTAILSAAILSAVSVSGVSSAHDVQGSLANIIPSIDVYHTSCFTWSAAGAAPNGASTLATQRFVARVGKKCTTNNAACNAQGGTVRVSIGAISPIAASTTGANASTTTAINGGAFHGEVGTGAWTATPSAWARVANNGAVDKNGLYVVAISHADTIAHNYLAQFHCEKETVGSAVPASDTNNAIHTGTGVTLTGGQIASPFTGAPAGAVPLELSNDINQ